MMCKIRGIYGFLGPSWVLITYNICPPRSSRNSYALVFIRVFAENLVGLGFL